jgi:uncharacterized protein (DUF885 family)
MKNFLQNIGILEKDKSAETSTDQEIEMETKSSQKKSLLVPVELQSPQVKDEDEEAYDVAHVETLKADIESFIASNKDLEALNKYTEAVQKLSRISSAKDRFLAASDVTGLTLEQILNAANLCEQSIIGYADSYRNGVATSFDSKLERLSNEEKELVLEIEELNSILQSIREQFSELSNTKKSRISSMMIAEKSVLESFNALKEQIESNLK